MLDSNTDCKPQDTRRVIATSGVATVEACTCGVIHVHVGPLSLRFTETSLHQLNRTIANACIELLAGDRTVPSLPLTQVRGLA